MRTSRLWFRSCVHVILIALSAIATARAEAAESFDGEWLAIAKCGASKFHPKTFPAYSTSVALTVKDGRAAGRRQLVVHPGFEEFTGNLAGPRPTIRGHGKFDSDAEDLSFDTVYVASTVSDDRLVFAGTMVRRMPPVGRRAPVRDCELTMTRARPAGSSASSAAAGRMPDAAFDPRAPAGTNVVLPGPERPASASHPALGHEGRRVALVVGNSAYRNVSPLDNPANDARLMADTLQRLHFSLVGGGALNDLDKAGLDRAVQEFGTQLQGADVGLFYFAGHGVQVHGANYLVPIDSNLTREADVAFEMLDAELVLRQMEAAATRLNLVILDACRNNPFVSRGLRALDRGLAQMRAPEGTLISFATQPGAVAQDGANGHSPFATALAQAMLRPGLGLFDTFNDVGLAVQRATGGAQQPWLSSSPIAGTFYFAGPPTAQ
jgi:hypothetical protein